MPSRGGAARSSWRSDKSVARRPSFLAAGWAGLVLAWAVLQATASPQPERWRWSNPLPHGNNVLDMWVANDLVAQVGDAGTVYVQELGGRWIPAVTGVSDYLRGLTFLGDRFLVVGEAGCILWSDDGRVFHRAEVTPATADWFEGVTASSQRAVAVGDYGAIYTSTNGLNWTRVASSPTQEWLRSVANGNGVFIAVGENGTLLRSNGGLNWTKINSGTSAHLNRVRFSARGAGQFMAVGNGGVALTAPAGGTGWNPLPTGSTNHLYDVAFNDAGILLVGDQELRYRPQGGASWTNQVDALPTNAPPPWVYISAGGVNDAFLAAGRTGLLMEGLFPTNAASPPSWQPLPNSSHAWIWDVTVQNGTCVAVGDLASILTSLDGILWAREIVPVPQTNTVLLGVGGSTNLLLAAGNDGLLLYSVAGLTNLTVTNLVGTNLVVTNTTFNTLGVLWTNQPSFTTNTLQGVAASASLYALCGDGGSIFTSPDGSNWTAQPTPTEHFLSGIAAFPGGWVAVGQEGTLLHAGPEAQGWSPTVLGTTNWLYRVRWVGNLLVVVGQNGSLYTSANGRDWTRRPTGLGQWLNDVTFLEGTWYVVGTQGLLLASTNLVDWDPLPVPTIKSLFGAATWNGQLLLTGIEGVILRNQVVPELTPVDFLGYHRSLQTNALATATQTNLVTSAYELFLFGGEPDQFFQFQSTTNLAGQAWVTNAALEMFDASGTLYLIRTRDLTNTPPREWYRTELVP